MLFRVYLCSPAMKTRSAGTCTSSNRMYAWVMPPPFTGRSKSSSQLQADSRSSEGCLASTMVMPSASLGMAKATHQSASSSP